MCVYLCLRQVPVRVCVCGGVMRSPFYWLRNSKMTHPITDKTMPLQPLISHTLPDIYEVSAQCLIGIQSLISLCLWSLQFRPEADSSGHDVDFSSSFHLNISISVSLYIWCSSAMQHYIDMAQTFFWYFFFSSRFRQNCLNKSVQTLCTIRCILFLLL